jgi:hypothetical protein
VILFLESQDSYFQCLRIVFIKKCPKEKNVMKTTIILAGFFMLALSLSIYAQPYSIKGQITDTDNMALPGVSILIKNTMVGNCSDVDGYFVSRKRHQVSSGTLNSVRMLILQNQIRLFTGC